MSEQNTNPDNQTQSASATATWPAPPAEELGYGALARLSERALAAGAQAPAEGLPSWIASWGDARQETGPDELSPRAQALGRALQGALEAARLDVALALAKAGAPLALGKIRDPKDPGRQPEGQAVVKKRRADAKKAIAEGRVPPKPRAPMAAPAAFDALTLLAKDGRWGDLLALLAVAGERETRVACRGGMPQALAARAAAEGAAGALAALDAMISAGAKAGEGLRVDPASLSVRAMDLLIERGASVAVDGSMALRALVRDEEKSGPRAEAIGHLAKRLIERGARPLAVFGGKDRWPLTSMSMKGDTPARREIQRWAKSPAGKAAKPEPAEPRQATPRIERTCDERWRKSGRRWAEARIALRAAGLEAEAKRIELDPRRESVASEAMEAAAKAGAWDAFFKLVERGAGRGQAIASARAPSDSRAKTARNLLPLARAAAAFGVSTDPAADIKRWSAIWVKWAESEAERLTARKKEARVALSRAALEAAKAGKFDRALELVACGAPLRALPVDDAKKGTAQAKEGSVLDELAKHPGGWAACAEAARLRQGIEKPTTASHALLWAADAAARGDTQAEAAFKAMVAAGASPGEALWTNHGGALTGQGAVRLLREGADAKTDGMRALRTAAESGEATGPRAEENGHIARVLLENGAPIGGQGSRTPANLSRGANTPARIAIDTWRQGLRAKAEGELLRQAIEGGAAGAGMVSGSKTPASADAINASASNGANEDAAGGAAAGDTTEEAAAARNPLRRL
jgi:hypothetical protein